MSFDLRRLRLGERIAGLAAVLLFVDLFLDWYGRGGGEGQSAWKALGILAPLLFLLVLTALALAALSAAQRSVSLPIAASVVLIAFGIVMTLLVLYRVLLNEPGADHVVTQKAGAWIGLILCAAVTYGGYRSLREEGTGFAEAKAQAELVVSSRGRTVPGSAAGESSPPEASPERL